MDGGLELNVGRHRKGSPKTNTALQGQSWLMGEGKKEQCCALEVMKDSCANSDFDIIMAVEERENGTIW